jgi:integrase
MAKERKGYVLTDKDGKLWARLTFTDEITGNRKNIKRRVETRTEGRELLKKLIREFDDNGGKSIETDKLTFVQVADIYKKTKIHAPVYVGDRKVAGMRSYKNVHTHLLPLIAYFGRKTIKTITASDVQKFKLHRLDIPVRFSGGQRAIASVNRELALLRSIFNLAKSEGWILRSPFESKGFSLISSADEVKRDRVLSADEEKRLLLACSNERRVTYTRGGKEITATVFPGNPYLRAIIITALDTGMRRGELLTMTWNDVNFPMNEIQIRAFNTKTGSKRSVGMTSRVRNELNKLWELSSKNKDARFLVSENSSIHLQQPLELPNSKTFVFMISGIQPLLEWWRQECRVRKS